jgi:predicted Rossmann fold flavoprotein
LYLNRLIDALARQGMEWDVVVVGAGAAGLLAAIRAAESGRRVLLLEKNKKPGVKILMSGGTRCNLTHATDRQGIVAAFGKPGQFLHSALAALGPDELVQLIEAEGVKTKVEPTGKVFPVSDKASDVLAALLRRFARSGAELALGQALVDWAIDRDGWTLRTPSRELRAREVVLTSGGQSYPGCGTTGDGYCLAARLGHSLIAPRPALVPLTLADAWAKELSGVTLPDVVVKLTARDGRPLDERRGGFLFTHFGCSGPSVLDISRTVTAHADPGTLSLRCDWLPALPPHELLEAIDSARSKSGNRTVTSWLAERLPQRLAARILTLAKIEPQTRIDSLSKALRRAVACTLKATDLHITGSLGFAKAEVTAGGIALSEVDSRNMRSKIVPRLRIAGEVLDLDGPIGGYNFQAAFSTGWLAGELK